MRFSFFILFSLFLHHVTFAEESGPYYAGTATSDGTGDVQWNNTGNAVGSTFDYAVTDPLGNNNVSDYLLLTNFGINIPTGYKVDGIKVEVRWKKTGTGDLTDNSIKIINGGTIAGDEKASGIILTTTATTVTYGGSSDLWGLSFNEAEIEASNFGVAISVNRPNASGTNPTADIDWVRITITSSFVVTVGGAESDRQVPAGGDDIGWTPLNNQISGSDDIVESVSFTAAAQESQYLIVDNFGLSINSVNEILGIQIDIERRANGTKVTDYRISLVDETGAIRTGTNKATGTEWPTTDATATYGGSADLWGEAAGFWTPAKLNDPDFGVAIAVLVQNGGGSRVASIDYVTLTITYSVPLPVTLTKFKGKSDGNIVSLDWQTATEINNDYFEIQRASLSQDFSVIGEVAGNGNSEVTIDYRFVDHLPEPGINYYRLRQVDFDGKFEYSPIIVVNTLSSSKPFLSVYPNPVEDIIYFKTDVPLSASRLEIFDLSGKQMMVNITEANGIRVSDLKTGIYTLRLTTPVETFSHKFVKR